MSYCGDLEFRLKHCTSFFFFVNQLRPQLSELRKKNNKNKKYKKNKKNQIAIYSKMPRIS